VFSYCNFSFGGKTSPYGHNTYLLLDDGAGSVSIDHCSFSNSQGNGIWIQNKATTESTSIQNTSISNLTGSGIVVNTDVFNLNVNGITLCDGGGYPIYIRGIHAHQFTGLNISNFAQNYIGIMGYNQSFNATWQNHGIPYRMLSHYYVNDWVTLTLSAGVNIVFNDYTAFYINGAIICNGTQSQPVSITGLNPDSGSTWLGLKLADTEYTSHFYYTDFKNAGMNEQYDFPDEYNTLYAANADLVIDHCSFAQGSHNYLKIMNGSIVNITHSTFSGAGGYGIITSYSNVSILYSTITGCDTAGIYYYWGELQFGINQSQWNRIYGNGINLHNACIEALLAQYIYWGSLNSGVIDAGIHDDNEGSAMVTFNPWFNEELTMLYDYTLDTPENVQITRLNSSTLRISWNGATGATSYKIVSSDAPDAQVWTPLANGLDTLFYDVTLPVGADKKFYRVYGVR
jgi:hypothetical protein